MDEEGIYHWYIMKCPPRPGEPNKLIGPYDSIEERDAEVIRLQAEEDKETAFIPNKRMSRAAYSYWRCNVKDTAAEANARIAKARKAA